MIANAKHPGRANLWERPRTVAEYLAECEQVFRERRTNRGATIPQPLTFEEFDAFCDRWPERAHEVRPADTIWLKLAGLSTNTGRPVEPWSIETQERFIQTLVADADFAATVAGLLAPSEGVGKWD